MSHPDREYLLARAEEERESARKASDEIVRAVHLKLAHEYSVRAQGDGSATKADNHVFGLTSVDGQAS